MKKYTLYILLFLLFNSCIEEITFNDSTFDKLLVVKANLTDEFKTQEVELSRINALNSNENAFETNAIVTIVENSQKTFTFYESTNGIYKSNLPFKAILGKQYSLHVKTKDGKTYISNSETIQGINNIDDIVAKAEIKPNGDEGINIFVKSKTDDLNAKYYRYTYKETYKITAPQWSEYRLKIISDRPPYAVAKVPHFENKRICYSSNISNNIIQAETASLGANSLEKSIRFILKNDQVFASRYSILVEQHVQSYEAYTYFNTLSKLSSSENIFSQSQPGFIQGNIFPENSLDKKVVGFFEVTSVSRKRVFFNRIEVYPGQAIKTPDYCQLIAPLLTERVDGNISSPLIDQLKRGDSYLFFNDNPTPSGLYKGEYLLTPKKCGDCRELGSNIKPSFWID